MSRSHMKNSLNIFLPIRKVDEEKRLVFGLVTEEIVDQAGEILDYETSKSYFQDWSDGISKATSGESVGNLRLMHQPIVAGKLVSLEFDDVLRQISCVAKIVSDDVWKLVLEGCLTGFSMGGKYIKRWKDAVDKTVTRFTAKPVEVSVVDNPCVQTATFEFQKIGGGVEIRKFHTVGDDTMITNEQVLARAQTMAKAAGREAPTDEEIAEARTLLEGEAEAAGVAAGPGETTLAAAQGNDAPADTEVGPPVEETEKAAEIDPTVVPPAIENDRREEIAKTLVQVWQAPDGRISARKSDLVSTVLASPAVPTETPVEKALREARGEPAPGTILPTELEELAGSLDTVHKGLVAANEHLAGDIVQKGLYEVSRLAELVGSFRYCVLAAAYETKEEGDNSPVPAKLMEALQAMGAGLVMMAQEEVAEMMEMLGENIPDVDVVATDCGIVELSALVDMTKANDAVMQKAGARNSRSDKRRIQSVHDNAVELGAACEAQKALLIEQPEVIPVEIIEAHPVVKGLRSDLGVQTSEVQKALDGIASLGAQVAELGSQITALKNQPRALPPRSDHVVVERGGRTETLTLETLEKMSPDDRADLAIRLSQLAPITPTGAVGR